MNTSIYRAPRFIPRRFRKNMSCLCYAIHIGGWTGSGSSLPNLRRENLRIRVCMYIYIYRAESGTETMTQYSKRKRQEMKSKGGRKRKKDMRLVPKTKLRRFLLRKSFHILSGPVAYVSSFCRRGQSLNTCTGYVASTISPA